jgi:tellurite resistance protein TehA-like permease
MMAQTDVLTLETLTVSSLSAPPRLREMVRQFTPNWFAATMGTGGLALALNQFPFAVPGMHEAARALWLFNIGLFCLFSLLYAARWIFFFHGARRIFMHPTASCSLAASRWGLQPSSMGSLCSAFRFGASGR